jgi:hypothetical protein
VFGRPTPANSQIEKGSIRPRRLDGFAVTCTRKAERTGWPPVHRVARFSPKLCSRKAANLRRGCFRSSERNPALSGETVGAHPACRRKIVGVPAGNRRRQRRTSSGLPVGVHRRCRRWNTDLPVIDRRRHRRTNLGLPGGDRRRCRRELIGGRRLTEGNIGQGEAQERRTWHATWPVSVGQDPGEAPKLRRGSAIAKDVTVR